MRKSQRRSTVEIGIMRFCYSQGIATDLFPITTEKGYLTELHAKSSMKLLYTIILYREQLMKYIKEYTHKSLTKPFRHDSFLDYRRSDEEIIQEYMKKR